MAAKSVHHQAVDRATDDMHRVIDSFEPGFMSEQMSPKTEKRRQMFSQMSPDLQAMLVGGLPAYMVEKLAKLDQE